jgi:hypothetical protein
LAVNAVLNTPESTVSGLPVPLPPPVVSSGQKVPCDWPFFRVLSQMVGTIGGHYNDAGGT